MGLGQLVGIRSAQHVCKGLVAKPARERPFIQCR
jgi:hypothetical protein